MDGEETGQAQPQSAVAQREASEQRAVVRTGVEGVEQLDEHDPGERQGEAVTVPREERASDSSMTVPAATTSRALPVADSLRASERAVRPVALDEFVADGLLMVGHGEVVPSTASSSIPRPSSTSPC
ncbi:hypothetical protein ACIO5Z_35515 [Streptomyces rochei]|uniref:hypothetical protein n=1 Tax=Streptomyces rochei TaxID=1928 RepID=UPI0038168AA8